MTALLLGLAFLSWLNLVLWLSGGWASTSGAVYTASGVAMVIAVSGQALVRALAPRLSSTWRNLVLTLCLGLVALALGLIPVLLS